jgi:hypothetical protein
MPEAMSEEDGFQYLGTHQKRMLYVMYDAPFVRTGRN